MYHIARLNKLLALLNFIPPDSDFSLLLCRVLLYGTTDTGSLLSLGI